MDRIQNMIGESPAFLDLVERISRVALIDRPVIIVGERGTGKELIAQRLHRLSERWGEPLVTMNCAALPETLIEAELFGHEAGAFTGAARARAGRFEQADGGTLFLDELGNLSLAAQERLLRAVEYGEVTRIGASLPTYVDVRLIGATNADLPMLAESGKFRADLLDRLSFEVISVPPLRAREDDIALLAEHFGRRMAAEIGWTQWSGFDADVKRIFAARSWPGNVRELRNVVERAVHRWDEADGPVAQVQFDPFDSPWRTAPPLPRRDAGAPGAVKPEAEEITDLRAAVDSYERALLASALAQHRWNQRSTASALGLSYDQLRHSIKKHGLNADA